MEVRERGAGARCGSEVGSASSSMGTLSETEEEPNTWVCE